MTKIALRDLLTFKCRIHGNGVGDDNGVILLLWGWGQLCQKHKQTSFKPFQFFILGALLVVEMQSWFISFCKNLQVKTAQKSSKLVESPKQDIIDSAASTNTEAFQ